ncbi:4-diphosphocytidyl-2-C-methyl-D-erythritol kinase [Candidatus Sulfotelmatomonas gaucii]|uniref:4-diphosphocytidyl-2-C-methyl-D-erythritol kinase n=1 Tax=Candidatus Sulfuritelmatomonas gaucii TaxID=2043161 RepID=A0A2N9M0L2_9BACT|nr:4-diphosphocytidyl-2-C-methyl-D-erythritol kinase [Candidatus Sulfotelmatomonas gaucii]
MPTRVRSHAKINLGLFLGAPRSDGFHSLVTVYQTLEIHDIVTVTARLAAQIALRITSNDARVPIDDRNTAWKMISLALKQLGVTAEVDIHIDKRLPVQGGLGAGSGNAVAALVGLENELGVGDRGAGIISPRQFELAAKVGSDVPLFLVGGTVLGVDRGQQVSALPDIEPTWCVIAVPGAGVSTPQAFRDWDALCAAQSLTTEASADRLEVSSQAYVRAFRGKIPEGGRQSGSSGVFSLGEDLAGPQESALVRTGIMSWIENDFERVVFPQHPSLAEIKRLLAAPGTPEAALYASLSGSGSALFGLYLTQGDAQAAKDRVESGIQGVKAEITRTLPRAAYWDQMLKKAD